MDLKNKAKDCEFGDLDDSLVKGRFVRGIIGDRVRADLSPEEAVDFCTASEIPTAQVKALSEEAERNTVQSVRRTEPINALEPISA